jgi:4'-phosphopantetheinyl transferase
VPNTNAPAGDAGANGDFTETRLSLEENAHRSNPVGRTGITPLPEPAAGVRLWWCDLAPTPALLAEYAGTLSPSERARAARFGTARLRDRYVMGRGSLRELLGRLLAARPATVPIVRGLRGRPQLADAGALDFNVSHTADVALIGVTEAGRIGVDVESGDRAINAPGIARKFLTHAERDELATLDTDGQRRRVLTLWTCKEAMSKATGDALSAPFGRIDVDVSTGRALRGGAGAYVPDRWALHAARVPSDYIASVAIWHSPRA